MADSRQVNAAIRRDKIVELLVQKGACDCSYLHGALKNLLGSKQAFELQTTHHDIQALQKAGRVKVRRFTGLPRGNKIMYGRFHGQKFLLVELIKERKVK